MMTSPARGRSRHFACAGLTHSGEPDRPGPPWMVPRKETLKLQVGTRSISRTLLRLRTSLRRGRSAQKHAGDELPLRSELFSADQMEQHGKTSGVSTSRFMHMCLAGRMGHVRCSTRWR